MLMADALGYIGGAVVTCSLIPQIYRVIKLKSAREISLLFTILLLIGVSFWLAYGLTFKLAPVILWNAVSVFLIAGLLFAKLKYGR